MNNSVIQKSSQSFNPNALITNNFTITAPSSLPIKDPSKIKAYLVNGYWDDYGVLGSVACSLRQGSICSISNEYNLIASGTNKLNGSVTNVVASNCSVDFTIEWVYEGDDCPPGYCKCDCINYPGYCCYDNNGNPL
ncbi:MAG TPA: hypothetical protein DEV81_10575 [Cyanobacteria bacterium UBA11049]|nr:hypothetical protein [Cyanobacteria bacterium UBA11049]